jgi:ribosomal protein S18 acetylase RimI-like enzyme
MKAPKEVTLRNWTKADFQIVRNILLITWKDTYTFIHKKDIITHLDNFYSESKLLESFNNPSIRGFLTEIDKKSVGWMKLLDDLLAKRFFISSLYVLPKSQGFGVGKKLILQAKEIALKLKHDSVWLRVMENNTKALDWYRKMDFNFVEEEPFKMGETQILHLIGYKVIT